MSKQCLKLEGYLELEPLFKISLKTPDASQKDVVNDLLMLKSHCREKHGSRRRHNGDSDEEAKPSSPETSIFKSKALAGLEDGEIVEEAAKRYDHLW